MIVLTLTKGIHFFEVTREGTLVEVAEGLRGTDGAAWNKRFATLSDAAEFAADVAETRRQAGWKEAEAELDPRKPISHAELEKAMAEDPEDPQIALVYADWLQAQGHPRGELIVVQHARTSAPDDPRLREHELSLFRNHGTELLGDLIYLLEAVRLDWRHGYVQRAVVDCAGEAFDAAAVVRALLEHPSGRVLRGLAVRDGLDEQSLADVATEIGHAPLLHWLVVQSSTALTRGALTLDWTALTQLRALALGVADRPLDLRALRAPELRHLELAPSWQELGPGLLEEVAAARLPELRTLVLHDTTDADVDALLATSLDRRIEVLGLPASQISSDAEHALEAAGYGSGRFHCLLDRERVPQHLRHPTLARLGWFLEPDTEDNPDEERYEHVPYIEEP